MWGRVKGVVVERVGPRRGILLSRDGAFHEVWLSGTGLRVGREAEGIPVPRLVVRLWHWAGSWSRPAVAAAAALSAAGAVLGALYLRGPSWPAVGPAAGLPGEGVVDAGTTPGPAPWSEPSAGAPASRPASRFARRLEAPRLSVAWYPSDWASVTLRGDGGWPVSGERPALWTLRYPLALTPEDNRVTAQDGASGPPGIGDGSSSHGPEPAVAPAPGPAAPALSARPEAGMAAAPAGQGELAAARWGEGEGPQLVPPAARAPRHLFPLGP